MYYEFSTWSSSIYVCKLAEMNFCLSNKFSLEIPKELCWNWSITSRILIPVVPDFEFKEFLWNLGVGSVIIAASYTSLILI